MQIYPATRLRRLRKNNALRALNTETFLRADQLVLPLFIIEGNGVSEPISAMPGVFRYSIDQACVVAKKAADLGIRAVAIFPVISASLKDEKASHAFLVDNLVCRTIGALKKSLPDLCVIADIALDPFTSHGHDGILAENGSVANDQTVVLLAKQAVIYASAGADILAPSDMMDGRIGEIRSELDFAGYSDIPLLSYAAKYASCFYGPFREAVGSASALGSSCKKDYQMNPANSDEALREVALDLQEGADMILIKPAQNYLDIIFRVKQAFSVPVWAYQVSGEYAMLIAAIENGWLDRKQALIESVLAIRRAGADIVITYAACEIAEYIKSDR
jgi:porphobilinogen synthase